MRKEDQVPNPAHPPFTRFAIQENSFLRMATTKPVFVDRSRLLSMLQH